MGEETCVRQVPYLGDGCRKYCKSGLCIIVDQAACQNNVALFPGKTRQIRVSRQFLCRLGKALRKFPRPCLPAGHRMPGYAPGRRFVDGYSFKFGRMNGEHAPVDHIGAVAFGGVILGNVSAAAQHTLSRRRPARGRNRRQARMASTGAQTRRGCIMSARASETSLCSPAACQLQFLHRFGSGDILGIFPAQSKFRTGARGWNGKTTFRPRELTSSVVVTGS